MPSDPFPLKVLLTVKEVMTMLSMGHSSFYRYLEANPTFPKSVLLGKTKKGQEIRRYRKAQVLAFLELLDDKPTN